MAMLPVIKSSSKFFKMKKIANSILPAIVLMVMLSSCYSGYYDPYYVDLTRQKENFYYAPQTVNPPLLADKNDMVLAGHFVTGDKQTGTAVHAAYAPAEHVGVALNYLYA